MELAAIVSSSQSGKCHGEKFSRFRGLGSAGGGRGKVRVLPLYTGCSGKLPWHQVTSKQRPERMERAMIPPGKAHTCPLILA